MTMYKYTTDTFSLSDEVRFNKWFNQNTSYDLENSPINKIFQNEAILVDISPETYNGLSLQPGASYSAGNPVETFVLTEKDVEGYFEKYPHHDANLSDIVYQQFIKALKNGQSTLDVGEKESLPEDYNTDEASATAEEYYKNKKPQTKEFQYVAGDTSSKHFHFLDIDSDGNGWTYGPMTTDNIKSPDKYYHIHEVKDYKVLSEPWIGKEKLSKPITAYNVQHIHELQKLTVTVPAVNLDGSEQKPFPDPDPAYKITIKSGNYPGESLEDGDIIYRFLVTNLATNLYEENITIPGSLTTPDIVQTDQEITNLAKAYFKDLTEKYPNYELKDDVGLFSETGGEVTVEPPPPTEPQAEDEPTPAPYLEATFDDQRYSEELFIGINNLDKINPFDIPTTMGYLLFSRKMLKDYESNEKHWMEMLTSYTVPRPIIKPSKASKKDKSGQLSKEDFETAKGEQSLLKENSKVNDFETKLNKYNLEKLTKQFSGNTAFPDLESGLNKLRGSENAVASVYGEVLHRVNIRELLVRAMACLVAKLNPGDWVEIACKIIIKEVAREIGFNKVKKIIIDEWDKLSKSVENSVAAKELKKIKKKFQEAEKSGALVDRKKSKNLTIIDGKDPFSEEFGQIQQRELAKEKERNISNKAKIDDFAKDIKDFIDLDALCERFGEFINDAIKLLFSFGGLGMLKLNFNLLFPGLPKFPTILFPTLPTKDIMKELIEAIERAAKEMIVRAIVDLIKGIIDEALSQCEDVVTPAPIISPEQSIGIPELVPNIHGAASPLNYDNVNRNDLDDLGIPPHMAFSVKELLDWMAQFLKPNQLCKLLSGTSSEGLLRIVLSQIEQRYEVLSLYIKTTADVRRLFVRLGEKVDQTFCTAVVSNVSAISDLCEDIIDNSIHEDALRAKGFSVDEAATIILEDRNRKLEALEKLSEYFVNPDAIQSQVPSALCTPSSEGLIPRNPSALTYNVDTAVETIFDSIKHNFEQDSENLKDEYIKIGTVVTNRIKIPKAGEDFPDKFTILPITDFTLTKGALNIFGVGDIYVQANNFLGPGTSDKSGKYLLLSKATGDFAGMRDEIEGIIRKETISIDGSTPGLFGPVFETEQKRMVLPALQDVAEDPANYIRSTHYTGIPGQDRGLILLNKNKDPSDDIELSPLEPNIPLNLFFKSPGFDISEIQKIYNKIESQLSNSDNLEEELKNNLEQQKNTLQTIIETSQNSLDTIILNLPTVEQSIIFNPFNKQISSMEDRYTLTIREEKLLPYEERILGEGTDPDGPGFITSDITVFKNIDPDVRLLIEELLSDPGENIFTSLKPLNSYEQIFNLTPFPGTDISMNVQTLTSEDASSTPTELTTLEESENVTSGPGNEIFSDEPTQITGDTPVTATEESAEAGLSPLNITGTKIIADIVSDTASSFLDPELSLNKYKDRFKAFKSVLFAKLLARKYKQDVLSAHSSELYQSKIKEELLNLHFYHMDNTLISLHEKNVFHLIKDIGFKVIENSPLFDLATFEKLDITLDDAEDLKSNKCLTDNSAGASSPDSLLDIDKMKEFVNDNYQQKTCLQRSPEEPNPLKESILEAGIMTLIRVAFIDYCFNSLLALTTGELTDGFANEQTVITVANKVDKYLSSGGPDIRENVYDSIVKYLNDQMKLNIDLLDPFEPDNLSVQLTDENITPRKALKFLCKRIILQTLPLIDDLISDFKEEYTISGMNGLLAAYMNEPNNLLDPPSSLNKLKSIFPGLPGGFQDNSNYPGHVFKLFNNSDEKDLDSFIESTIYKDTPNVVYDSGYDFDILKQEISDYAGMFFIEKYVRVEYLHPPVTLLPGETAEKLTQIAESFFFLSIDENDTDEGYTSFNVTSLRNLQRIILLQTMISSLEEFKDGSQIEENDSRYELLISAGINPARYNSWAERWGPKGTVKKQNRKDYINFKLGTRLVYKMPSENLSPLEQGLPPRPGYFIKNSPHGKYIEFEVAGGTEFNFPDGTIPKAMFSNTNAKNNFEKIQFKEATYQIRTIGKENLSIVANLNALEELGGGSLVGWQIANDTTPRETIPVKDYLMLPIASSERNFTELNNALSNYNDIRGIIKAQPLFDQTVETTISLMELAFNTIYIDNAQDPGDFPQGVGGLGLKTDPLPYTKEQKNLSLNSIITSRALAASSFEQLFNGSYKTDLLDDLQQTPEVKLLVNHLLPPELFKNLATEYMNIFPKSKTIPNDHFFNQTKNTLFSLFNAVISGEDFKYRDPGGADGLQKHKNASKRRSTQINIIPSLQKLALETVPMIVKGMAETIDPAVATANFITIATGIDPKETKNIALAFLPPPLFPPLGFNNIPITELGMAHIALEFSEPYTKLLDNKKNKEECNDETSEDYKLNNPDEDEYGEGELSEDKDLGGLK